MYNYVRIWGSNDFYHEDDCREDLVRDLNRFWKRKKGDYRISIGVDKIKEILPCDLIKQLIKILFPGANTFTYSRYKSYGEGRSVGATKISFNYKGQLPIGEAFSFAVLVLDILIHWGNLGSRNLFMWLYKFEYKFNCGPSGADAIAYLVLSPNINFFQHRNTNGPQTLFRRRVYINSQ